MTEDAYPRTMRLQRFLARAGVASRRGAERLMTAGRVRVNGQVVSELGSKVDADHDTVTVDGVVCSILDESVYLLLNKPAGYLTTMSDPYGRPTVAELVPVDEHPGLFPVGRLDADTTGILLFTTNGDAGQGLLHPSKHVDKQYTAVVKGVPANEELERLRQGIVLDDGPCAPAAVRLASSRGPKKGTSVVEIRIHEGRKHQVKRMMEAIGHEVVELRRDSFGPLTAKGIAVGAWRLATPAERDEIERAAGLREGE